MEVSFPPQVPLTLHLLLSAPQASAPDAGVPAVVVQRLARWLGRGDAAPLPAGLARDHAAALAGCTMPVAWAALGARGQGEAIPDAEAAHWLCLEPMYMAAGMNSVRMAPLPAALDAPHLERLAGLLAPLTHDSGILLRAAQGRLLARFPAPIAATCQAPELAVHGKLRAHLPAGPDAGSLRRLMTECQMLLHQAADAGTWPESANALWPWGNGAGSPTGVAWVYSDDVLLAALRARADQPGAGGPPQVQAPQSLLALQALLDAGPAAGAPWPPHLVLVADARSPALPGLLDSAEAALARRHLASIVLGCWSGQDPAKASHAVHYRHRARWRFWRSPSPPFPVMSHA